MARNPKGDGAIYVSTDRPGYIAKLTVDNVTHRRRVKTRAEANAALRQLRRDRANGTLSQEKPPTLNAWLDHWLNNIAQLEPRTKEGYRGYIQRYVNNSIGKRRIDKLTAEHIEELYAALKAGSHTLPNGKRCKPLSGSTLHQLHTILRKALKVAQQRGKVARNVAADVTAPSISQSEVTTLSLADTYAILATLKDDPYEARWLIALTVGIRPAEALGLTWDKVDLDAGTIRIEQQLEVLTGASIRIKPKTKTARSRRTLTLPGFVADSLRKYRRQQLDWMIEAGTTWRAFEQDGEPRALVFTLRDGSPLLLRHDSTLWSRLLVRVGLPHVNRYTTRHTSASLLIDQGIDITVVAAILGHKDSSFTYRTYVHPFEEKKAAAAQSLDFLGQRR